MKKYIESYMETHREALSLLQTDKYTDIISDIADQIIKCFENGGKLLICGNGGSAADAQHIAAEFVVRFKTDRKALPAIALNANSSSLTAIGNDFSADRIYERQVEAFGTEKDVLMSISTSGNSENIFLAMERARKLGMGIVAFLGSSGGKCGGLTRHELIVPCDITSHIQEMHIMCAHIICGIVDAYYEERGKHPPCV